MLNPSDRCLSDRDRGGLFTPNGPGILWHLSRSEGQG